jgi:Lon protease-like protein
MAPRGRARQQRGVARGEDDCPPLRANAIMVHMERDLLPLFPLQLVLFPGTQILLHIFEDRYKEMIGDAIAAGTEFGVVRAGERGIVNTGCTAIVERVLRRYPDGRLDILVAGRRRFEIVGLNDDKSYLRGSVNFYDDDDFEPAPEEATRRAMEGFEELRQLKGGEVEEPAPGHPRLSFQIAQPVEDLDFRQLLLATRSEAQRMKQLAEFLSGYVTREKRIQHTREVAPRNGHGKLPGNA